MIRRISGGLSFASPTKPGDAPRSMLPGALCSMFQSSRQAFTIPMEVTITMETSSHGCIRNGHKSPETTTNRPRSHHKTPITGVDALPRKRAYRAPARAENMVKLTRYETHIHTSGEQHKNEEELQYHRPGYDRLHTGVRLY